MSFPYLLFYQTLTPTPSFLGSGLASYVTSLIDQTLTWNDIAWLRKNTTMKIVVKGVLTVEDALASVKHGKSHLPLDKYDVL